MAPRRVGKQLSPSMEPDSKLLAEKKPDWRVAIDFGTTFTTIDFMRGDWTSDMIETIEGFPGDHHPTRSGTQVPTVIWYTNSGQPEQVETSTKQRNAQESAPSPVFYGYQVAKKLELTEDMDTISSGIVSKPKLLLDKSPQHKKLRKTLTDVLRQLKEDKLIRKEEDVIERLLACFLQCTNSILERDHHFRGSDTGKLHLLN
jgi:hypothetical protein